MSACVNGLIKHSDDVKYCDSKYNTRKSGGEHTFSYNAYDTMQRLVKKIQQYKLGELTKSELKQIAKALYWVEDKLDIGKYTFQDLIDVIDEYREMYQVVRVLQVRLDHDARTYHIGDRVIPFSSCVIKEGKIYYLTPMCKVLVVLKA